jgi:hypothetical protein
MKIFSISLLLIGFSLPAYAYIDPGTGMLAVQGLIAFLVAVIAFIRNPIHTFRRWWQSFLSKFSKDPKDPKDA